MASDGIAGLYLETRNWGKTAAFWKSLGYEIEFETDHGSGMLRHPAGGIYLFVAERPDGHELETYPIVQVADHARFDAPAAGSSDGPFEAQHWDVMQQLLRDPDGRHVSVQAPLPEGVEAPVGHG